MSIVGQHQVELDKEGVASPDKNAAQTEEREISEYDSVQKRRRLDFKGHVHLVSVLALYLVALLYGAALVIWFWHLVVANEELHIMSQTNFSKLQSLLFGSILGGFASHFSRKIFDD